METIFCVVVIIVTIGLAILALHKEVKKEEVLNTKTKPKSKRRKTRNRR